MRCGLIGRRLGHSYSCQIHHALADYSYELWELEPEELAGFLEKRDFAGINVTIPYKEQVIPYLDELSETARAIGAVNTVVNRNGRLVGDNTDLPGMLALIRRMRLTLAGKKVLILGTGGTSKTARAAAAQLHAAEIYRVSRCGRGDAITYQQAAAEHGDAACIINTTPCGMFPNVGQCLIDPKAFPALEAVLDVVYNPFRTELLLRAEDCGVTAAGGFEMLVAQAVFATEHFTGRQLDTAAIIPAVSRELRHQLANVSIIGMPGCGKSTLGAALAKRLDKKFVDLDAEIERRTGHNIPDIFAQEGEAAFRRYEADVLAEVAKGNSQVIACGGGVIKSPANTRALRQNGPVLWVRRPLEALATGGRPLSKGGAALKQLEAERTPLYEAASTVVLENNGSLTAAVDKAVQLFEADERL